MSEEEHADLASRTLRAWAVFEVIYGIILALAVILYIPWKSPGINAGLVAYAALSVVAAPGLWKRARWGWRLAVVGGTLGFLVAILLISGLLSSWAYLHGIFGDFGRGASIAALLFASVALQVVGLYPALKLRALLRREVRDHVGAGKLSVRVFLGLSVLPFVVMAVVHFTYQLTPLPQVSDAGRDQAVAHVRAALRGEPRPEMPALAGVPVGDGPLFVTLWGRGRVSARVRGDGEDLAAAVKQAAEALSTHPKYVGKSIAWGTLKFDRVVASGPVLSDAAPVVALSVNPGLDGLRRHDHESDRTLLPDDLVKLQAFAVAPLVPGIRELRFGLDAKRILTRLGMPWAPLTRVRTEAWIEHEGKALSADRGNTPTAGTGPDAWRAGAIAGGDFVLRQIMKDGRFHYQYYPLRNFHPPPNKTPYSLPRHAGTVYSLALLYGETQEPRFKEGAEKAIAWLDKRIPPRCGGPDSACVAQKDVADLGSTALTLVGMLEYTRRTEDRRYEPTIRKMLNFVLRLQRDNGDFNHVFRVKAQKIDTKTRLMFYSEEASLALVMAHEVLGDDAYLKAAERALDYLTGPKYDYFVGRFIYGADHWTCIAAEEAWPALRSPQYLDFCKGYAGFVRRMQYEAEGWDNADFRGHYGFSGFMVPQAPGAAGFTEAVVSTVLLDEHHNGERDPAIVEQMAAGLDALVRDQIRADNSWMMPNPRLAYGGIRRSLVEQEVRIDFTQHALSALIRGAAL